MYHRVKLRFGGAFIHTGALFEEFEHDLLGRCPISKARQSQGREQAGTQRGTACRPGSASSPKPPGGVLHRSPKSLHNKSCDRLSKFSTRLGIAAYSAWIRLATPAAEGDVGCLMRNYVIDATTTLQH